MEFALINRAVAEEAGRHGFATLHAVAKRYAGGQRQSAADDRIASIEPSAAVEEVHGPTASSAAALDLTEHFGHEQAGRNADGQAPDHVRGRWRPRRRPKSAPAWFQRTPLLRHRIDGETLRFFRVVEFNAFRLEMPDANHLLQQMPHMRMIEMYPAHLSSLPNVDRSPSGRPSSRASRRRRMIFPLRVLGKAVLNSISFGATAACNRLRA